LIALIPVILLLFSVVWFMVWYWFFKPEKPPVENFYKLALKAFESGDYKTAKAMFLKMPKINSNLDAKYKLGISFLKLKEYKDAQSCLELVVKKSPKNLDALNDLAKSLSAQEEYDAALGIYTKLSKIDSKNLDNFLNISKIHCKKGDYSDALSMLEKIKKKFPNDPKLKLAIINCKSKMCDKIDTYACRKMLEQYEEMANSKDLPPDFYVGIAKAYAMNGEIEKAFENCQKAIEITSEDVEAYQLMGLIQLIKRDMENAKTNLTVALNFEPGNEETHNIFSYVLCQSVESCTLSKCRENYFKLVQKFINK